MHLGLINSLLLCRTTNTSVASLCSSDSVLCLRLSCSLLVDRSSRPLSLSALLQCSFSLLLIHVTLPNSIILLSPSQPAFFNGSTVALAICVLQPCFHFFISFSFPSESITLPSSSQPFFSLFRTFNSAARHTGFRATNVNFQEHDARTMVE